MVSLYPVVAVILYCDVTIKLQATKVFYISGIHICSLEKSDFPRDACAISIAEAETTCVLSLILNFQGWRWITSVIQYRYLFSRCLLFSFVR